MLSCEKDTALTITTEPCFEEFAPGLFKTEFHPCLDFIGVFTHGQEAFYNARYKGRLCELEPEDAISSIGAITIYFE